MGQEQKYCCPNFENHRVGNMKKITHLLFYA